MMRGDVLIQYVIYDHPADYPGDWVVREWRIRKGRVTISPLPPVLAVSLEDARGAIPAGMVRLPPDPGDDPTIAEIWT